MPEDKYPFIALNTYDYRENHIDEKMFNINFIISIANTGYDCLIKVSEEGYFKVHHSYEEVKRLINEVLCDKT